MAADSQAFDRSRPVAVRNRLFAWGAPGISFRRSVPGITIGPPAGMASSRSAVFGRLCLSWEFAMQQSPVHYWFPAKRYGWGWGLPSSWQGWAVLAGFVALLLACAFVFPPSSRPLAFAAAVCALSVVLVAICFAKGEPPAWRWGK